MSQDIADMPGIEAAVERFNAMDLNGAAEAARVSSAKTTTNAEATPANGATNGKGGSTTGQNAQATANGRSSPAVQAQSSVTSTESGTSSFAKATEDRRAATDVAPATPKGFGADDKQQRDAQGRFIGAKSGDSAGTVPPHPGPLPGDPESVRGRAGELSADGKRKEGEAGKGDANADGNPEGVRGGDKSRYAKAQERLEKTWESVNKRKTELDSQAQALEQQRLTLERDKAQFEAVRRQAEQPQATPEQALQAAQMRRRDADALRMQARRAAEGGRTEEAQRLNKQADKADGLADDLAEYAEQLRRNPPVSMQQRQQQFEQARKQWTVEACNAFPELEKNGSRLQQVVAQHLNALAKQDPQLLVHPSLIYHVARLADAQIKVSDLQAAAARVPVLEEEAERLRARIKELEAETTPAGNGGVNKLGESAQDDYASLRQSAAEIGNRGW
jgi:hypothetical protein